MLVPPIQAVVSSARRIEALFGQAVKRNRFVILSLSIWKTQIVFDRDSKKFFRYKLRNHIDLAVFDQIFLDRQYDWSAYPQKVALAEVYRDYLLDLGVKRGPLILDLGSNNGISTSFFQITYPMAQVVGVEPDVGNLELSRTNAPSATFIWGAVTNSNGFVAIANPEADEWAYRVNRNEHGRIPSFSVPSILEQYPNHRPFIIKIDVEGSEESIFAGDASWVDSFPLVIIELHDWMIPGQANSANFIRAIAGKNRDLILHGENLLSFRNS
jgi:FkbM family methyltransferase